MVREVSVVRVMALIAAMVDDMATVTIKIIIMLAVMVHDNGSIDRGSNNEDQ